MTTTLTQFVLENVTRSAVLKPAAQGWATFNIMGNSPKTSTRAIRRKLEKLIRRDAKKGGAN
jgi:hypothetical protein